MRIIGFTGSKGSGKSTAAEALFDNAIQVNFADPLKDMFEKIIPYRVLYGNSQERDTHYVQDTKATARKALQNVGIAMRELDPDFWVKLWAKKVEAIKRQYPLNPKVYKFWTIGDVRFENEAKYIRDLGGCIIHIHRPNSSENDNHVSELALPDIYVDVTVENNGSIKQLHQKVKEIAYQ